MLFYYPSPVVVLLARNFHSPTVRVHTQLILTRSHTNYLAPCAVNLRVWYLDADTHTIELSGCCCAELQHCKSTTTMGEDSVGPGSSGATTRSMHSAHHQYERHATINKALGAMGLVIAEQSKEPRAADID